MVVKVWFIPLLNIWSAYFDFLTSHKVLKDNLESRASHPEWEHYGEHANSAQKAPEIEPTITLLSSDTDHYAIVLPTTGSC